MSEAPIKQVRCANSSTEKGGAKCSNDFVPGHIYCTACRLATGGYLRYNPPRQVA